MTRRADVATRRPGLIFAATWRETLCRDPQYGGALEPGSANAALGQLLFPRLFLRIYLGTPYADALVISLSNFTRIYLTSVEFAILR